MTDTFLVEILRAQGCSQKQAAAFERCLIDRPICGIGPKQLTLAVLGACVRDMQVFVAAMRDLQAENERLVQMMASDEMHQMHFADSM
jgi:hypothetical protein